MSVMIINGWQIEQLPEGWDFRFSVERKGYGEKFYSRAAAVEYANTHA
jgi:hypothetical protein